MWIETYPSEDLLTRLVCILKLIMAQKNEYQHKIQIKRLTSLNNTMRLCILRESMLLPGADLTSILYRAPSLFHVPQNKNGSDLILLKYRKSRSLIQIKC